jgi:hypothetical protein
MSVLAELLQAIAYATIDLIVMLTTLASKPLRFLASSSYRCEVRENWRRRRARHVVDLLGGSIVIILFLALLVFLGAATISSMRRDPATAEAESQQLEAKFNRWLFRTWEKLREKR